MTKVHRTREVQRTERIRGDNSLVRAHRRGAWLDYLAATRVGEAVMIRLPPGGGATGNPPGRERRLEIVPPGLGIDIEDLAGEVEPFDKTRRHGMGIDLRCVHTPGGHDSVLQRPVVGHPESEVLQPDTEPLPFLGRDPMRGLMRGKPGLLEADRDQATGKKLGKHIPGVPLRARVDVPKNARVEGRMVEGGFEIDGQGDPAAHAERVYHLAAESEDDGTGDAETGE